MKMRNKQIVFVEAYLRTWNATQAGRVAGYSERSVRAVTSRLLTNANIQARIKERLAEMLMSSDEALALLTAQARGDMGDFLSISENGFSIDLKGAQEKGLTKLIKKAKVRRSRRIVGKGPTAEEWEDEIIEIELYDAQNALQLIGRHHKLFEMETETNIGVHVEGLVETIKKVYGDNAVTST